MSSQEPAERWVTVEQACSLLSKSDRTIRRWAQSGKLPSKREGARLWLDVSEHVPAFADNVYDVSSSDVTIASLRAEVDKLQALVSQLTSERDYLRGALASALRISEHKALEPPRERSWWQFWRRSED